MSWQEELRKLDEELASGRLSADEYRVRRDQVLSSAVGQPDAPADSQPGQPGQPGQPVGPSGPAGDHTQVIPPISPAQGVPQQQPATPDPERTQAVPPWQPPPGGQYPQQQFPAAPQGGVQPGPASPAHGFPASPAGGFPQQPWNAPEGDQAPPWGGGDLPPLAASGGDQGGWGVQQGPESFDDKPSKGNGPKIAAIAAIVVVLVGIALGAYLLWGRGSGGGAEPPPPGPGPQPSSPAAPDPLPVAKLPGKPEAHDDVTTFNQVSGLNYLNSDELSRYSSAGASATKYVVHHLENGNTVVLLLTEANSPVAAQNAANQLMQIQINNGASRLNDAPKGVYASEIQAKDGNPAQVRGHYASRNIIVRIEVFGPSLQSVETDFNKTLSAQTQVLSVNG